jgi:hypothetical protein
MVAVATTATNKAMPARVIHDVMRMSVSVVRGLAEIRRAACFPALRLDDQAYS